MHTSIIEEIEESHTEKFPCRIGSPAQEPEDEPEPLDDEEAVDEEPADIRSAFCRHAAGVECEMCHDGEAW